ncbi:hypothetical protein CYMTET_51067 [Cymbomonas tetramitiformis]|uniref:Uncharacterized protein n=1 Tax=Cymbomonas tetramitiformis TaxID=36881 RepID=A0AAE0BM10_9CHLO|nr:hypothetical protein CYMTET_51067 [Cymbomonas tetramitiformis]
MGPPRFHCAEVRPAADFGAGTTFGAGQQDLRLDTYGGYAEAESVHPRLDPAFYAAVKVRYPMAAELAHVPLASLRSMVVEIYQAWAQTDTGKAASGADGISAHLSSSEYDALLVKITELKELVADRFLSH